MCNNHSIRFSVCQAQEVMALMLYSDNLKIICYFILYAAALQWPTRIRQQQLNRWYSLMITKLITQRVTVALKMQVSTQFICDIITCKQQNLLFKLECISLYE